MKKYYVLFNPLSGRGGKEEVKKLETLCGEGEYEYVDVTELDDVPAFLRSISEGDDAIVCGGDGTLNKFANAAGETIGENVYYYPCGTGNDFYREVESEYPALVPLKKYLSRLPVVEVNGEKYRFINVVGYGIDGYCCEVGDELRKTATKPVNYTTIAIKGLLFHYKPTNATVIVDGKEYTFEKVWLAPAVYGKYYGGGMIPAPAQKRDSDEISVMLFHGSGRLSTLMKFPSIFKGEHVKYTKNITILTGKEITVRYDEPRAVQIDGETVLGVSEYTARR